jgi:hypothetical protein
VGCPFFVWGCMRMPGAEGGEGINSGCRGLTKSGCSEGKGKFSCGSAWAAGGRVGWRGERFLQVVAEYQKLWNGCVLPRRVGSGVRE